MALLFFLEILQAPYSLVTPLEDALISDVNLFAEKRHALPRSECLEEETNDYWVLCLLDT
jgi:hypothetical protein